MAQTKLGDLVVNTTGNLPATGATAPAFTLTGTDLKDKTINDFSGKTLVLNIFPSVDTRVCATSVREFNKRTAELPEVTVLCISRDLPFAQSRFCGAEGINNVVMLSDFRNKQFAADYGVELADGGFAGLLARSVIVIGQDGEVKHAEMVPSIGQEPDYDAALKAIK